MFSMSQVVQLLGLETSYPTGIPNTFKLRSVFLWKHSLKNVLLCKLYSDGQGEEGDLTSGDD